MKINTLFASNSRVTLTEYLHKCGIQDINEYIDHSFEHIEDCENYDKMGLGFNILFQIMADSDKAIYIISDSDADGVTSSVIAYLYLKHLGYTKDNVRVLFHKGKQHGLSDDVYNEIKDDCGMLWIPDAGTNDVDRCKELFDNGVHILITDHHQKNVDNPYAVIINNQVSPNVTNKDLAGVGVTFKFIEYCCRHSGDNFYQTLIDLVSLGNLSDVMDMRSLENRAFNVWGLEHIINPFLKKLCERKIKNSPITPTNIVWNVTPLINSVCRSDNQQLKKAMFDCFVINRNDYDDVIGQMNNQHDKQSRYVKKMYDDIIKMTKPNDDKVMILETKDTPYTGLVANKLRDYYGKPVLLVHKDNNEYIGSCRSYTDMLTPLRNSGLMTICAGHNEAFGVGFMESDLKALKDKCEAFDIDEAPTDVVQSYTPNAIPNRLFTEFDGMDDLWGEGISEPLFYIHNIQINSNNIRVMGKNKTTIKFNVNGIDYIKFFISHDDQEKLLYIGANADLIINLTCKLRINWWQGRMNPQCVIERFEVE